MIKPLLLSVPIALSAFTPVISNAGELNVYTSDVNGFDTHTFWYDDGEEITVIDTQFVPQFAQKAIATIKAKSSNPITRVIITHPNPDKFNGLTTLHAEGAVSIASNSTASAMRDVHEYKKSFFVNVAKSFTEESYPTFTPVKRTFEGISKIQLKSGETITLIELKNAGISSNQTVVRIDETGDLLVGDLIHHNAHAWLEGGIVDGAPKPDITSWQKALDELLSIENIKTVHGGRGESATIEVAVDAQKKYLADVQSITKTYIQELGQAKSELFDPNTATKHHKKLQKLISDSFPDYKLPYMIKYGIYGLAQSLASAS